MPSPFPGMDPWVEAETVFRDFHHTFIVKLSEICNRQLPPRYYSSIQHLAWHDSEELDEPDFVIIDRRELGKAYPPGTLRPLGYCPVPTEQVYLEIFSPGGERRLAAISLLTHATKRGGSSARRAYRKKRRELRAGRVTCVEFDLLGWGRHTTAIPSGRLQRLAGGDLRHHLAVTTARGDFYGAIFPLKSPLPDVVLPIGQGVEPVTVELQPLINSIYDSGRYAELLDYEKPCDPPLSADDQAWAAGVLKATFPTRETA